ncbi:hypothetical protein GALMADRAFT_141028 [Galerina marginata CBS 339.88]|uniref:F-box domain-containing protein n=1 Tax=Galerina marginata (strain CBS 339.88) TaxID=685588 RepID=A0A067SX78_GALM3|nr:hypothetical protein GALMADRAFT_141028 [Galerina marginata CBS 339.88]
MSRRTLDHFWTHRKRINPQRLMTSAGDSQDFRLLENGPRICPRTKRKKEAQGPGVQTPTVRVDELLNGQSNEEAVKDIQSSIGKDYCSVGANAVSKHWKFFPFLSLPLDLVLEVLQYAFQAGSLISLARTCRTLRSQGYRTFLCLLRVIRQESCYTSVHLEGNIPFFAVFILTSFQGLDLGSQEKKSGLRLQIDLFNLVEFNDEICKFALMHKISSVTIQFHSHDQHLLRDDTIMLTLISMLTAIDSFSSINIWKVVAEPASPETRRSRSSRNNTQDLRPSAKTTGVLHGQVLKAMKDILFLNIHADFFHSPALRTLLPSFLRGASICEVDLECSNMAICADILSLLDCPSMERFSLVVWDPAPVLLPAAFFDRHRCLESLRLLSHVGRTNAQQKKRRSVVLLLPSTLKSAQISANYSGWKMDDVSSLSSFEIQPLTKTVQPHQTYCDAVNLLLQVMQMSSHLQFSDEFILTLSFPARLTRHIRVSTEDRDRQCKCMPIPPHQAPIRNILSLKLEIDILCDDSFVITFNPILAIRVLMYSDLSRPTCYNG